jgi:tetratricopeptide (TPR) repeat protein
MTRESVRAIAIAALLAVCFAWTSSKAAAEPMVPSTDLSASTSASTQPQEVTDALSRFEARDYEGALKLLKEAVKKNADYPPALVLMAQFYAQANMASASRNALEQAVIEESADPEAYWILGNLAVRERRATEAELVLQKANTLVTGMKSAKRKNIIQAGICSGLAQVAELRDNWPEVKKQLDACLKVDPNNVVAMQRLANCLVRQKDLAGALQELKKAEKADKADQQSLSPEAILARMCEQAGDRDSAKKYMAAALTASPKDFRTRLAAAQWAFETGQFDEAQTQADAAVKLDDKSLDAKILRGVIALFRKDFETAERCLKEAHLQAPDNLSVANNLALALVEQTDKTKKNQARGFAENNARQYPNDPDVASTYGWVLFRLGQTEEAERVLRGVASSAVANRASLKADTAYYLAAIDVERNRETEAKTLLEGALKATGPFAMRQEAKALLERLKK